MDTREQSELHGPFKFHLLGYSLRPDQPVEHWDAQVHINALGLARGVVRDRWGFGSAVGAFLNDSRLLLAIRFVQQVADRPAPEPVAVLRGNFEKRRSRGDELRMLTIEGELRDAVQGEGINWYILTRRERVPYAGATGEYRGWLCHVDPAALSQLMAESPASWDSLDPLRAVMLLASWPDLTSALSLGENGPNAGMHVEATRVGCTMVPVATPLAQARVVETEGALRWSGVEAAFADGSAPLSGWHTFVADSLISGG
jgi:hypothetical protein